MQDKLSDIAIFGLDNIELCELHTHLGFSISATMLWELAHDQGLKLPAKSYWEFEKIVSIRENKHYEEYLQLYDLTELIQSSPQAMFVGMQNILSGAYRKSNITCLEIRFNPLLRTRNKEIDVDHIITFALQGLESGMLKYPIKAGLVFCMDRRFSYELNEIIVNKAIKYSNRGVVGIDLAGPITRTDQSSQFNPLEVAPLVKKARAAGLGVTVHTGEATGLDEMQAVISHLRPDRIGHGIACAQDERIMEQLREGNIVLELCPTSNLNTSMLKDWDELRYVYQTIRDNGISFTINTDGPEMQLTSLKNEYSQLMQHNVFSLEDLLRANQIAHQATFIR